MTLDLLNVDQTTNRRRSNEPCTRIVSLFLFYYDNEKERERERGGGGEEGRERGEGGGGRERMDGVVETELTEGRGQKGGGG